MLYVSHYHRHWRCIVQAARRVRRSCPLRQPACGAAQTVDSSLTRNAVGKVGWIGAQVRWCESRDCDWAGVLMHRPNGATTQEITQILTILRHLQYVHFRLLKAYCLYKFSNKLRFRVTCRVNRVSRVSRVRARVRVRLGLWWTIRPIAIR